MYEEFFLRDSRVFIFAWRSLQLPKQTKGLCQILSQRQHHHHHWVASITSPRYPRDRIRQEECRISSRYRWVEPHSGHLELKYSPTNNLSWVFSLNLSNNDIWLERIGLIRIGIFRIFLNKDCFGKGCIVLERMGM